MTTIADTLERDAPEIIARYRERLRARVMAPGLGNDASDETPALLEEMVHALRLGEDYVGDADESTAGSDHGGQRFALGYHVGPLVREYGVILEVLWEHIEARDIQITPSEARTLSKVFVHAVASAATAYGARRDAGVRTAQEHHVAFLAHELRNPINAVAMALALAKRTGEVVPGRLVAVMDRGLKRVTHLLESALIQVRVHAGAELERTRWDLETAVRELAEDVAAELDAKRLTLRVSIPAPLEIEADRRVMGSVLSNLVRNAIKFTREGGTIEVRARASGLDKVVLEVEDECGGLPPGAKERLFQAFVQRDKDRSGFGLGLAIAKDAVEAHHGEIRVRDLPGRGCIFAIELPRAAHRESAAQQHA